MGRSYAPLTKRYSPYHPALLGAQAPHPHPGRWSCYVGVLGTTAETKSFARNSELHRRQATIWPPWRSPAWDGCVHELPVHEADHIWV